MDAHSGEILGIGMHGFPRFRFRMCEVEMPEEAEMLRRCRGPSVVELWGSAPGMLLMELAGKPLARFDRQVKVGVVHLDLRPASMLVNPGGRAAGICRMQRFSK